MNELNKLGKYKLVIIWNVGLNPSAPLEMMAEASQHGHDVGGSGAGSQEVGHRLHTPGVMLGIPVITQHCSL